MSESIRLKVFNQFRKVIDFSGSSEWQNGQTTIEASSRDDGKGFRLYIQNKGFGRTSKPSVETTIDNETALELFEFLKKHIDVSKKVDAMNAAAASIATPPGDG